MVSGLPHIPRARSFSARAAASADGELPSEGIIADILRDQSSVRLGVHEAEFRSLAQERNPEMFFAGLLNLGMRLEGSDRLELAAAVYAAIRDVGARQAVPLRVFRGAQARLNVINGTGPSGARAEFLLRRLARESLEPTTLLGMGAASAAFRVTRLALLSRIVASPTSSLLTRGLGARAVAGIGAFGVEAAVFPLATRLGNVALGRHLDWSPGQVGRELGSSFIVLGALKLGAVTANSVGAGLVSAPQHGVPQIWWRPRIPALGRTLGPPLQQAGMFGGILLGHRMEEAVGLRPHLDGATTLVDSLALLLQFNIAGNLARQAFGQNFHRWERDLDARAELGARFANLSWRTPQGRYQLLPAFGAAGLGRPAPFEMPQLSMMASHSEGVGGAGSKGSPPSGLIPLPQLGLYRSRGYDSSIGAFHRVEAGTRLEALMPAGRIHPESLAQPGFVEQLLSCFAITTHPLDVRSFRRGFEIAQKNPELVQRMAFDVDEVYLHWAITPPDLFRGLLQRGRDALFQHTSQELLRYRPFESEAGKLRWYERIWYRGMQRLVPTRQRQNIQFHPGVRAFQLGLRLGQNRNLILSTTGPAGKLLILANEDPAMRMIYFGKTPEQTVSMEEIRGRSNIYVREHMVMAMRELLWGEAQFPQDPQVRDYIERVRRHPAKVQKLKHPALATLLGKRPFDLLVDDSAATYQMLGGLENFTVLRPPSARPPRMRNFVLFGKNRYLNRMSNGYVEGLAQILESGGRPTSQPIEDRHPTPADYPHQRFAIEFPWSRNQQEYASPMNELRALAPQFQQLKMLESHQPTRNQAPLTLRPGAMRSLVNRVRREMGLWTEGSGTQIEVQAGSGMELEALARRSEEEFQAFVGQRLTARELTYLNGGNRSPQDRNLKYYSRIAASLAAKRSGLELLGLKLEAHGAELEFRFGRPLLSGAVLEKSGGRMLMTTLTSDGEIGIGMAAMEAGTWESGLSRIGLDITTDRVSYTTPEQHALAEAAHKAVFQGYVAEGPRQFNKYRAREIEQATDGYYYLSGRMAAAARGLRGERETTDPLRVLARTFRIGRAVVAMVGIPVAPGMEPAGSASLPPVSWIRSTPPKMPAVSAVSHPYSTEVVGQLLMPRSNMTVAILGDVGAARTYRLASMGHRIIHIDWDAEMLHEAVEAVANREKLPRSPESYQGNWQVEFVGRDWYQTQAQADLVEAFYTLDFRDLPVKIGPERDAALSSFLEHALLSKLKPGGGGYVVSEHSDIISDLGNIISRDPRLVLIEADRNWVRPPIVGGFGSIRSSGMRHSWLVFALAPPNPTQ